ncbi:MAG: sigma-70 family RNA polymerase sigma factor [Armatimonadetes bacterium]|nr:sigma-70 family RNA polymerase sigma factor [Armatimonadota bacterium]
MNSDTDGRADDARDPTGGESGRPPFAQVVADNYERIYNVIYRLVNNEDEAADLTQDTFVAAYRAYDRFRHEASVYTWLYRIAVNLSKNRFEKQQRTDAREAYSLDAPVELDADEVSREVEDWDLSPECVAENRQLRAMLLREVAALKYEYREVVVLRDLEGLRYRQIAEVLGCSVEAVKSRLFRARSVLRQRLGEVLEDMP